VAGAQVARFLRGGGRGHPGPVGREGLCRSQADDYDAAGRERTARVEHGRAVQLAREVTAGDQVAQGAAEGAVHGAGRAAWLGHAFKQVGDQGVRFSLGKITTDDIKVHSDLILVVAFSEKYSATNFTNSVE
jgi:hypothetical protein